MVPRFHKEGLELQDVQSGNFRDSAGNFLGVSFLVRILSREIPGKASRELRGTPPGKFRKVFGGPWPHSRGIDWRLPEKFLLLQSPWGSMAKSWGFLQIAGVDLDKFLRKASASLRSAWGVSRAAWAGAPAGARPWDVLYGPFWGCEGARG